MKEGPVTQQRLRGCGESGAAGLTLIELLIALVLTALLVTAMSGTLALGGRMLARFSIQGQDASQEALGLHALRGLLESIRPLPRTGPQGGRQVHLRGGADWLVFLGDLGPVSPLPGLRAYRLAFEPASADADAPVLMLETGAVEHRVSGNRLAGVDGRSVLLSGADGWRLAYQAVPGGPWRDNWPDGPDLPALIRVELLYNGDKRMPFFVAPRLSRQPPE